MDGSPGEVPLWRPKENAQGSVRSSPAQVLVSHCQLFVDVLSSASFVPLPLKVHVAIDSPPSPNLDFVFFLIGK